MLDYGLNRPPHLVGVTVRDSSVDSVGWDALTLPADAAGNQPRYVMLSWKIDDPTAPDHLMVAFTPAVGAPSISGATILHGLAHNPCIVEVSGMAYIYMASTGAALYVTVGSIGNEGSGWLDDHLGPLQIAADSVALAADNVTRTLTFAGNVLDSTGEQAKYVLLSWEERDTALRISEKSLAAGHNYLHGMAHNPIVLDVRGVTRWRYQAETGKTAQVHVTPLENG